MQNRRGQRVSARKFIGAGAVVLVLVLQLVLSPSDSNIYQVYEWVGG